MKPSASFPLILAAILLTVAPAAAETITRVVDGDTVRIGAERVRLRGIDAPELHNATCRAERRKAIAAKDALADLVDGKDVTVDRVGTDVFGRTLAVLRIDGWDVGSRLVAAGHALPWRPGQADKKARKQVWCGGGDA